MQHAGTAARHKQQVAVVRCPPGASSVRREHMYGTVAGVCACLDSADAHTVKGVSTPSSPSPPQLRRRRHRASLRLLGGQIAASHPVLRCAGGVSLYRLLQPLSRVFPHVLPLWLCSVLDFAGTYSLNLASVLAIIVTAAMLLLAPWPRPAWPTIGAPRRTVAMAAVFIFVSSLLILFPALAAQLLGLVRAQWLARTSSASACRC